MLMDPRRREDSRKKPEEEKAQEEIPEWQGVLFIENYEKKIIRIASVICRPPPPVPLPTRVQLNKAFIKMKHVMYQVCIGLPFFELHKANLKYNPESEWTKFLNFMLDNKKFATITCPGWKLYLHPPLEDPPHGFRPVRVHYERSPEDPMTVTQDHATVTEDSMTVDTAPLTEPVVHGSAPSLGANGMEVELEEVQIDDAANLKKCDQPKLKRPRREVEFHAPSSSQEETVSKGNSCATDTMNVVDERQPPFHGNDATVGKVAGCELDRIAALSLKHVVPKVVSEMKEKAPPEMVNHSASSGATPATEERMETYFAFNGAGSRLGNEGLYLKHDELATVPTVVPKVKEKAPEMDLVNRKATSGAAPATDERMENYFDEPALVEPSQCRMKKRMSVYSKPGAKQSRGRLMKHYSKTLPNEKLEGGGQNTDVPIPTAFLNGDFRVEKVVADKGKGRMSIKKKKVPSDGSIMRKTSYNGSIKNHIVHALPKVPEQFRVNLSSGGASSKDSRGDLSSGGVSSKDFRVMNLGSGGETSKDFRINLSK